MPKTATTTPSPKKTVTTQRSTAVERPHRNLTRIQEEVADIASDILLYGGSRQDLDLILTALARHNYMHMSFARHQSGPKPVELYKSANEYANARREEWYRHLCQHWPETKAEAEDQQKNTEPRPVTEMVRANIRESLRDAIDEILTDTDGIETIWLLNEIVSDIKTGIDPGEAIYYAMDTAEIYVRVPRAHQKRIEEFVAFLEKEEESD
jgi:hypothetical protein